MTDRPLIILGPLADHELAQLRACLGRPVEHRAEVTVGDITRDGETVMLFGVPAEPPDYVLDQLQHEIDRAREYRRDEPRRRAIASAIARRDQDCPTADGWRHAETGQGATHAVLAWRPGSPVLRFPGGGLRVEVRAGFGAYQIPIGWQVQWVVPYGRTAHILEPGTTRCRRCGRCLTGASADTEGRPLCRAR